MYVHACNRKLTGVAWVVLGVQGVIYEAVRHVSKHNTHEREHYTVDHGHHRPGNEQQNVPAVCEPELKTKKKQQLSESARQGGRILNYAIRTGRKLSGLRSHYVVTAGDWWSPPKQREDVPHSHPLSLLPLLPHTHTRTHLTVMLVDGI